MLIGRIRPKCAVVPFLWAFESPKHKAQTTSLSPAQYVKNRFPDSIRCKRWAPLPWVLEKEEEKEGKKTRTLHCTVH